MLLHLLKPEVKNLTDKNLATPGHFLKSYRANIKINSYLFLFQLLTIPQIFTFDKILDYKFHSKTFDIVLER